MRSQPNYLTTDASGDVSAQFTGGIQIATFLGSPAFNPNESRQVKWVRDSDGAMTAFVLGYQDGANDGLYLSSQRPDAPIGRDAFIDIASHISNDDAHVYAGASNSTTGYGTLVVNSLGQSAFLQLLGHEIANYQKLRVAFGATGAMFVNGGSITNSVDVNHGLGSAPIMVVVTPWPEDNGRWMPYYGSAGWNSTRFQVAAIDVSGGAHGPGNLAGTRWMAIG